jgi:hypothetical protein
LTSCGLDVGTPAAKADAGAHSDAGALPTNDAGATADAGTPPHDAGSVLDAGVPSGGRDWQTQPAIVQLDGVSTLYAVSDVHGGYDRLTSLLAGNHLIGPVPATPASITWTGGAAVLVVVGDLFDKGPQGVEVMDALRALQTSAAQQGGHVIVTLGNHEAEFLADPENSKATKSDGIDSELLLDGIDPADVANGTDVHGAWLRSLPFGARVGRWFFAHAGSTGGLSLAALEATLEAAIDGNGYGDDVIIGVDSLLEARDWYVDDPGVPAADAAALGAVHVVMGHDPNALGARGNIAFLEDGSLFRIDCGMSPGVDDSTGHLFRVVTTSTTESVSSLSPTGHATSLWSGPSH